MRDGLSIAQFLGCNKFIIQFDNVQVVKMMNDGGFSATSPAAIFDDCRILSSGLRAIKFEHGLRAIKFEHCNRDANEFAHELVRYYFAKSVIVFGTMIP